MRDGKRLSLVPGEMEKDKWIPESEEVELVGFGDYWVQKARNMKSKVSLSVKQRRAAPLAS